MRMQRLVFSAFAAMLLFSFARNTLAAVTNVLDPAGKTVLTVDGDNIKSPDGKVVMTIDEDSIKSADGTLVIYCNGDMIRDKPEGKLYLYIDGRHIRRQPGGTDLLYVDGKDIMHADRQGKYIYRFKGEDPGTKRLMAVLYTLMPELFGATKDQDAAMTDARAKTVAADAADAAKDLAVGKFGIYLYKGSDGKHPKGTVEITKAGDVYVMSFTFKEGDPLQGVAIKHGKELWTAIGPAGTTGLAVYKNTAGVLSGTWYNASGNADSFGTESLKGAAKLGGDYQITEAKAPTTHAPYTGTVSVTALPPARPDRKTPIYTVAWDLGTYKAQGIGFGADDSLIAASGTAPEFSVVRFKLDDTGKYITGEFYSAQKVWGDWTLDRKGANE